MKWFFLFFLLLIGLFYFLPNQIPTSSPPQLVKEQKMVKTKAMDVAGIQSFIGKTEEEVTKRFGQPTRIDDSSYDYKWWVYNKTPNTYLQIGMLNGRSVTAFIGGEQINVSPFRIGQPLQEVYRLISFPSTIEVVLPAGTYRFELSEQDVSMQPVVKMDGVYVQLYVDHFTGTITGIRIMDAETFVKLRPYELMYRGALLSSQSLSLEQQKKVEEANARQIFDMTNVIRARYHVPLLYWHKKAAEVAYAHSKEMSDLHYFSHVSPKHGDLKARLLSAHIPFQLAGENIAAQYVDGIAAVAGWLNSKSHRDTLLNNEFTHLGVGVSSLYYTQDFLKPWELPDK